MLILLLTSLVGSVLAPQIARFVDRGGGLLISILPFGLLAAFVAQAPLVEGGWVLRQSLAWAPALDLQFTLRLDGFSFLFCLLITGIGGLVMIYSGGYLAEKPRSERIRFFTLILLFMTAMLGTVMSDNLLVMVMFW